MNIKLSKKVNGIRYVERKLQVDLKDSRLITYSWPQFLSANIPDIFSDIYRIRLNSMEFQGFFYFKEQTFLLRCIQGNVKAFALDLRKHESTCLNCEGVELSEQDGMQLYIPSGIAWGALALDKDTILQIQSDFSINEDALEYIDPADKSIDIPFGNASFSIAQHGKKCRDVEEILAFDDKDENEIVKRGVE